MELETKDQININYNSFFYVTMCHVCKRFGDIPLKTCSGCRLISYCGEQHQKQHWAQHKPLCKAVQDVLKDYDLDKLEITPKFLNCMKVTLMEMVIKKKGFLKFYEKQMFFFTKECAVCAERSVESLLHCRNCALSFCKNHEDDKAHKDACDSLKLCLRTNLSIMNREHDIMKYVNTFLERSSNTKTVNTFLNMKDFINGYWNIQEVHSEMYDILAARLSIHLTRPLTLLYAMQVLNYVPKHKEIVIHVVAATYFEKFIFEMWEVLLHLISETDVSLMIVVTGTALNFKSRSLSICNTCLSQGKKISLEFHSGLYEDYMHNPSFVKPDFAVGFSANIRVEDNDIFPAVIKEPSLQMLAEQNCPFLLTHLTQEQLEKQVNSINTILNRKVDYVYCGNNPFASLRPNRCIIDRKLVIYQNNFVAIYRSLCS